MSIFNRDLGYLLLDGVAIEPALTWCYQELPQYEPQPLFHGTDYEPLIDQGPLLIKARYGDQADLLWQQPKGPLQTAVWLESTLSAQEIQESLQRRLQIFSPTGNALWLRLYDARPLLRAHQAGQAFPPGFWHGITSVWLQGLGNPFAAWHNPSPLDDAAPADLGITPQITLDWPLLQALANTEMEIRV